MIRAPLVRLTRKEEVAVQIDVLLVGPAAPCEPPGVERVDEHQCHVPRQVPYEVVVQEHRQLYRRAEETFDAVQAAGDHHDIPRRFVSGPYEIDGELLASRSGLTGQAHDVVTMPHLRPVPEP